VYSSVDCPDPFEKEQEAMEEVGIWIGLEIGDEPALVSRVSVIAGGIIDDLRRAVKLEMANNLGHCDAVDLQVFLPNHEPPFTMDVGAQIPNDSTRQIPLTIKAPKPQQGINRNL
jgi:hypothetical protein